MKEAGVEYTIAYIHWGNEYQTTENSTQRKIAAKLCELGIDALIGGHPHVVQPVDLLTNTDGSHQMLCVYSMGNHVSDQYKERMDSCPTGHTEDGIMVRLELEKTEGTPVTLKNVEFIPTWVYRTPGEPGTGNPEYYIMPLNNPEQIIKEASHLNIATDVQESLERTNAIIGNGVTKVKNALPIRKK
jgi:poly-gamma-glutamate synthesis protein (capsule biosynthesis protein)